MEAERKTAEQEFLDASQQIGMGLLRALDEACAATGTTYYLFYGTLLGAIRYGDWIPWDDDVDVAMTRHQFERFRTACAQHLPVHVKFSDARSDTAHITSIPRLLDLRTERADFARPRRTRAPETRHVALDIFILDRAPSRAWRHWLWRKRIRLLEKLIIARRTLLRDAVRASKKPPVMRAAEAMGVLIAKGAADQTWTARHAKACMAHGSDPDGCQYSLSNGWTLPTRACRFDLADIQPARPTRFRDMTLPGPNRPLALLEQLYGGGFMTPPPHPQRHPAHFRAGLVIKWGDHSEQIRPSQ